MSARSVQLILLVVVIYEFTPLGLTRGEKSVSLDNKNQKKQNQRIQSRTKQVQRKFNEKAKNKIDRLSSDSTISRKLAAHGKAWHYGENWPSHGWDICGEDEQSPIRLLTGNSTPVKMSIRLQNYNKPINMAFIENNGHTVQLGFSDRFKASVVGSAAEGQRFIFAQLHFHWGSYNGVGSEHTIDGYRGPMEVHFVHYNSKYGSFDTAVDKDDGLMVLGALFKISSRNNRALSKIISLVKDVPKYKDKAYLLGSIRLRQLLPLRLRPFYMYSGSLTSPPCYQSVQWVVFKHPVLIGDTQEKQFRKCRGEAINSNTGRRRTISNNYRPVQAINERQVMISS